MTRKKRQKSQNFLIINLILILASSLATAALGWTLYQRQDLSQKSVLETQTSQSQTTTPVQTSQASSSQTDSPVNWTVQAEPVQIPILMYHAIHVMAPEESHNANLIVAPDLFESHIQRLVAEGYYFLTPEEAYRALTENSLPSQKVVWLTFDDSLADFYQQAYPILTKYGAKATNNVITGFTEAEKVGHLTLDQLREMSQNGMSFQAHTVSHPDLAQSSPDSQSYELDQSKTYLDSQLQQDTLTIAYPAGRYSQTTLDLAASDYKLGLTTNNGLASASDGLLTLNRVRILPTTTADDLIASIQTRQ